MNSILTDQIRESLSNTLTLLKSISPDPDADSLVGFAVDAIMELPREVPVLTPELLTASIIGALLAADLRIRDYHLPGVN